MRIKLLALSVVGLSMAPTAFAQIVPNNSYAQMLTNSNAMLQLSISKTISSQAQTRAAAGLSGTTPSNWCSPLPPPELQRGADGHVPAELQGDPRYQEWLRCRQGQGAASTGTARPDRTAPAASGAPGNASTASASDGAIGSSYPTPRSNHHVPMAITDYVPAVQGHPAVEQMLASMPLAPGQRSELRQAFADMSRRLARAGRPNNLAVAMAADICVSISVLDARFSDADSNRYLVAINDRLSALPSVVGMSRLQKQNFADSLIFQSTMVKVLGDLGRSDPQARLQSVHLARTVLTQLTGSPSGRLAL
jgi:hypothetical protein